MFPKTHANSTLSIWNIKNAVKEFFWTASFAYLHTDHNLMTRSDYKDGIFYLSPYKKKQL